MINDFFPFTFKSNVFQKVGERKRMNTGGEEERGQRCKSEKNKEKGKPKEALYQPTILLFSSVPKLKNE